MIHHLPLSVISNQDRILSAQELMRSDSKVRHKSFPVRTRRRCQALESPCLSVASEPDYATSGDRRRRVPIVFVAILVHLRCMFRPNFCKSF
jgi:hypothetical protein